MATIASTREMTGRVASLWRVDATRFLQGTTLYLLCFAILTIIMFATPSFFSTDDYYHARISEEIIRQGRLALDFPWLPMTILSPDRYVDHHLLYHMVLAPAVYFMDDITGAKLVTVAIAAGIFVAAWSMFRQIGVRYPTIWTLGLFGMSATFTFRMLMIRTQGFSFLFLTLALMAMFGKRWRLLIPLAFFYVWLYNGFILMLAFAAFYCASVWISERRIEWRPFAYVALGLALGVVINPYFPRNVEFVWNHLIAKVDLDSSVPLGAEWNDFQTRTWLSALASCLLAMLAGFVKPSFGGKRDAVENTLMFCAVATMYMSFQSMRFLEYFPGFALMFAAASWGRAPVITFPRSRLYRKYARYAVPVILVGLLAYYGLSILGVTYQLAKQSRDLAEYQGAAKWLARNTEPGSMVLATGFNDFSRLFFWNQQNVYAIGLDPTYLQFADQRLWDEYYDIINGEVDAAEHVAETFNARYIVSGIRHGAFNREARQNPNLKIVYRDRWNYVYEIDEDIWNRVQARRDPIFQGF